LDRSATVIETDDDFRQALLSGLKPQQKGLPAETGTVAPPPPVPVASSPPGVGRAASLFRPTARPPIAMLTVYDDGKVDGDIIRIRDHRFVIGRTEGDLRIPIDSRISSRHVEITHQLVGGLHRWVVTDLQSTHGLFVRVTRTVLADKAEFLVGNGRYRFDAQQVDPSAMSAAIGNGADFGSTQGWVEGSGTYRPPAVNELIGKEIGNRALLIKPEYWIGSDPACPICRPDDPFCEPRHVRVYRNPNGSWHVEHNKTQNGLWLRMAQITVDSMIQFQIGEQRFRLRV
jgi:hypothetical protein